MNRTTKLRWLGLGAGALAALALPLRGTPWGPLIGVFLLLGGTLFAIGRVGRGDRALGLLLLGALAIRLAVVAADIQLGLFPKSDASGYHLRAAALAEAWHQGEAWRHMNNLKTASYELVIAPLYYWFGRSALLARVFNTVLATVATYNVFRIGQEAVSRRAGLIGAGVFAIVPSLVRVHGEHLREALIILLITQVLYVLVARKLDSPPHVVGFVGSLAFLYAVRNPTFVVLLAPVAVGVLWLVGPWVRRAVKRSGKSRTALLVGVVLVSIGVGVVAWMAFSSQGKLLSPDALTEKRADWAVGGSAYLEDVRFESWWDVVIFAPVGAAYFLFTPFPWQVQNLLSVIALAENLLLIYPIALLAIPGALEAVRKPGGLILISFLLTGTILYGLIEGNVGTVIRHRAQFTWVVFLLAGLSFGAVVSRSAGDQGGRPDQSEPGNVERAPVIR